MSLLGQPCQNGSSDREKCGDSLICNAVGHKYYDSVDPLNTCINPCDPYAGMMESSPEPYTSRPPGMGNDNRYYQGDPNKPNYDECIKGVGAATQNSTSTKTGTSVGTGQGKINTLNSQKTSQRQENTKNRFCLCPVDDGCIDPVTPPTTPAGPELEFNFLWIVGNIARNDDTRDWYEFGREANCKSGTQLIDRPRITASTPWAKRKDNSQICVEGNCCKDGPGPGRGEWDCGSKIQDGWTPAADTDTSREAQEGYYSGQGDDLYSCKYYFDPANGGPGLTNGTVSTLGPNVDGCEHFEFYCGQAVPCVEANEMFPPEVKDAFDISSRDFGGYVAFKVKVEIPPQGETREVFLHYHVGTRGAGGSKARMWVNELTKGQQDYATVSSAMRGNPGQMGTYSWDFGWDLCSSTTGGPNPTNPKFAGDSEATIGVLTVLPDGTWTVGSA